MKYNKSRKLNILQLFRKAGMIIIAAIVTIPLYYMLVSTFKTQEEAIQSPMGLPLHLRLDNYMRALRVMEYPNAFKNNFLITFFAVLIVVIVASMAGYTLARMRIKVNKFIYLLFLSGIMVPYQMLIFPLYKMISFLDLVNSIPGVIIISIGTNIPFAVFLFTGFVSTIPFELDEAARIDGSSPFSVYWRITLPLLTPVVSTVVILDSLAIWNDFLTPLLFLQSRRNSVLLLEVFRSIGQFSNDYFLMQPMLVLTMAPIVVLYLFLQRFIIKGITSGAIKG